MRPSARSSPLEVPECVCPSIAFKSALCVQARRQVGAVRLGLDDFGVHDWLAIVAANQAVVLMRSMASNPVGFLYSPQARGHGAFTRHLERPVVARAFLSVLRSYVAAVGARHGRHRRGA